ncbi:hypothetical protein Droror1_Dr00015568 [Drosera rotundifolia]
MPPAISVLLISLNSADSLIMTVEALASPIREINVLARPFLLPPVTPPSSRVSHGLVNTCDRRGHQANECFKLKRQLGLPRCPLGRTKLLRSTLDLDNSSYSSALWLMDSEGSHHITTDPSSLTSRQPYEGPDDVLIGDGTELVDVGGCGWWFWVSRLVVVQLVEFVLRLIEEWLRGVVQRLLWFQAAELGSLVAETSWVCFGVWLAVNNTSA